ncbi:gamma-glutamylcyclotransferase [Sphingosinithalassobacter sp. CS137]|uniref:gamma-glutamylcyclotransferase family protein n=1 Tax=Sphingosinithalassobacter sp. CS137 TaxID=2762748 RepID=UPI0021D06F33|nr:gamma-glutamylcyclotransferase family protein [Sphingosinithalassobacter sp. CS137]
MGRRARFVRIDWIRGRLFDLGAYPAARLDRPGWIRGEVFQAREPALRAEVDAVEDYCPDAPERSEYVRRRVTTRSGLSVWAYAYRVEPSDALPIRGGRWRPPG